MVPVSLRVWFTVHFIVDLFFGLPLMVAPRWMLVVFEMPEGSVLLARIVAAAFLAIGSVSFLMRNAGVESYRALLNLKIIWSSAAIVGIVWSLLEGAPSRAWLPLIIFLFFWCLWLFYRRKIGNAAR